MNGAFPGRLRAFVLALALLGSLPACDGLLDVDPPSRIPSGELEDPGNAPLLVRSAVGDFECALGAYVVMSGLIGEELADATQTADRYPYDRRLFGPADRRYAVNDCDGLGVYLPLNRARSSADNVVLRLESWTDAQVPNRSELLSRASAYAGYSLVLLGEGFCTATISSIGLDGTLNYGTELSRTQILTEAEARFTRALAEPGISSVTRNMARLGRARTRLNLGRYADARADAIAVDSLFRLDASSSNTSGRRQNRVWAQNGPSNNSTSVDSFYRALNDPRVAVYDKGTRNALGLPLWGQNKYADASSPIPVARWEEARLIVAEADARAGALESAIAIVNRFRARGNQEPLASNASQAEVLAAIIDQRRRELFLEGHHLGDVIRYNIALRPAEGQPYLGGGSYGNSTCLPLPDVERTNNPNID